MERAQEANGKRLHLICNAHLDPVWQWEWEEGAAAAVSTFRAAAEFCEEYDSFVFNHNEALLYKWIEEYEPSLFANIQEMVRRGRWHIMGGWYLQPDCNMPSGESFVRQILLGRSYFRDKFGVEPTTAINFDAFGHSRGLVQIMSKAGYDSYLFMRPDGRVVGPAKEFKWIGFDGSEILAHQLSEGYNSLLGEAHAKIKGKLGQHSERPIDLLLWGVGNHGGGPSRLDLDRIGEIIESNKEVRVFHSTPERYFAELREEGTDGLPRHENDMNPRFVGCYTSMIRVKQKHRRLENELYQTEKMVSAAALHHLLAYPAAELHEAFCDLMVAEFHDILPGSSVQPAEEASLRLMDHGLEIASRIKARAFFALAAGQPKAAEGEYPVLVYNPHPYPVRGVFACEFMLADQNWKDEYSMPSVFGEDGVGLPSQAEKEQSNLNLDWRKRVVFEAELKPSSMNRFDCRIDILPAKPVPRLEAKDGRIVFDNGELRAVVDMATGLLDEYAADGKSYLGREAFRPLVLGDNEDPWRMDTNRFGPVVGHFQLMDSGAGSDFSGVKDKLIPSVRVIEDGEVRTVIEALLSYGRSVVVLTYKLPKRGRTLEVHVRTYWNEKDKMLKLSIPTVFGGEAIYFGQTAYGVQRLPTNSDEAVAQKWTALQSADGSDAVTLINDGIYGSDCMDGEMRPTLLRGSAYCAHPILDRPIMPQDRFSARIDQGEREYTFWLEGGASAERLERVDREALAVNEKPYALSFFPHGGGEKTLPLAVLDGEAVQISAIKKAERSGDYIIRLFEPTGTARTAELSLPAWGIARTLSFGGFEIKTLRFDPRTLRLEEGALMEI